MKKFKFVWELWKLLKLFSDLTLKKLSVLKKSEFFAFFAIFSNFKNFYFVFLQIPPCIDFTSFCYLFTNLSPLAPKTALPNFIMVLLPKTLISCFFHIFLCVCKKKTKKKFSFTQNRINQQTWKFPRARKLCKRC